ncbi:uncharacterized protein F5891DRAFT_71882 [Suillus fuscotomentosus]|uniref:Uncharacterized protein n=1 Tax=Suillus fuscotomentosus TaxID=1912939 RepID=A0AAD4DRZ9_9AGAM|nr:uncharacterized protein F5891DRAFT_71882 [Suillus fuscotomentosus]KAG1892853.1 hypothetical protein F5891DRAFT_71882 [Suillus fuscotomentosus]
MWVEYGCFVVNDSCHRWGFDSKAISHCESCSLDNRCIFKGYCYVNHHSVVPLLPESVFPSEASFEIYQRDVLLTVINGLEGCCKLTCVHYGIIDRILGKPDAQLTKEALTVGLDERQASMMNYKRLMIPRWCVPSRPIIERPNETRDMATSPSSQVNLQPNISLPTSENAPPPIHANSHASMLSDPASVSTSPLTLAKIQEEGEQVGSLLDVLISALIEPVPFGVDIKMTISGEYC